MKRKERNLRSLSFMLEFLTFHFFIGTWSMYCVKCEAVQVFLDSEFNLSICKQRMCVHFAFLTSPVRTEVVTRLF